VWTAGQALDFLGMRRAVLSDKYEACSALVDVKNKQSKTKQLSQQRQRFVFIFEALNTVLSIQQ
jgi:hypothetical protein